MELINLLDRPGREYTPFPFWFLNDELTADELRRQLEDFAAHGVYGVVLHPRIGLPRTMPYLSEAFFDAIEAAVREAERLGMRVILYDEGMYPSGSACGQVVAANPDYASRGIDLLPPDAALEEGDKLLARTPGGLLVSRFTRGTIRGIHFGQDDGEPDAPPSTDLLNPDAVELFIRLTHDAYYKRLKQWFGTTVIAFFTDEPSIMGRNPRTPCAWTTGFEDAFTAAGGVLADLAALFCGEENASTRLYHRMILEMEGEVYYHRLSDWCAGHGIALVGHPHQSDDIEVERWFQIPGQDLALRWVAPEKPDAGIDGMMGHCSADAALLMGCRRNANECFGACNRGGNPWQLSGGDIKWYLDWLAVRGVNLFIPHAFYYSIEGARKDERPPDVGPHSSWWPRYRLWSDYIRRLSALMTDAEVRVRVALPCRNRDLHPETAAALERAQISCCCLPESVWPDCYSKDGRLYCRGLVFDAVAGDERFFPELPHLGGAAFDERSNWASDMFLYFEILQKNPRFAFTPEPLISIGVHEEQYTESFTEKDIRKYQDRLLMYEKYGLKAQEDCRKEMLRLTVMYGQGWKTASACGASLEEYLKQRAVWFWQNTVLGYWNGLLHKLGLNRGNG